MHDRNHTLISDNLKLVPSNKILYQEIQNELIILNFVNENYFGLDIMGTVFWKTLLKSKNTLNAYKYLLSQYEVTSEALKNDIEHFIEELLVNDLIHITKSD